MMSLTYQVQEWNGGHRIEYKAPGGDVDVGNGWPVHQQGFQVAIHDNGAHGKHDQNVEQVDEACAGKQPISWRPMKT
jgi:hypothetical protein